jgi:hypothetical protein
MVSGLHDMQALRAGVEYDLPRPFAEFLILSRKADYRPGRLDKFAPKEIRAPVRKAPAKLSRVLHPSGLPIGGSGQLVTLD